MTKSGDPSNPPDRKELEDWLAIRAAKTAAKEQSQPLAKKVGQLSQALSTPMNQKNDEPSASPTTDESMKIGRAELLNSLTVQATKTAHKQAQELARLHHKITSKSPPAEPLSPFQRAVETYAKTGALTSSVEAYLPTVRALVEKANGNPERYEKEIAMRRELIRKRDVKSPDQE